MNKNVKIFFAIVAIIILLTGEFCIGYQFGYNIHKEEANQRAKEMILNKEIPNYYMEVGTIDFIINNNSGELQEKYSGEERHKIQFTHYLCQPGGCPHRAGVRWRLGFRERGRRNYGGAQLFRRRLPNY